VVDGRVVARDAWQSRRARDLLKLLALRGGAPASRELLLERLWPDEANPAASRLSVTMSTLRAVLDPEKRWPPDHFVCSGVDAMWLDRDHVNVDLAEFLRDAETGLRALDSDPSTALPLLRRAEVRYTGDLLEDDPYADWTSEDRDHARTRYLAVARALADRARAEGRSDAAASLLLRILSRDPYDERAALELVRIHSASGSHGEARRTYRRYLARMADMGLDPAPFPGASRSVPDEQRARAAEPGPA
jgi:DNA-binding SARP family transcriptional activator